MNKSQFTDRVAERTGLSKSQVGTVVDAIFNTDDGVIVDTLKGGDSVSLTGFGSFKTSDRAARKGRNPQTGKEIDIAASTGVSFSAGKGLKDAVNTKRGKKKR